MSDEAFRRPGEQARPVSGSWPYESPAVEEAPLTAVSESTPEGRQDDSVGTSVGHSPAGPRFRSVAGIALVTLLVGVLIGGLAVHRPTPGATPITVDSFPQELLGLTREDVALRGGEYKPVTDRLDTHFRAELEGYRFAYGGAGAQFRYGEFTTLTIVNGQLAPNVPISDTTEWATPIVRSLRAGDTSCVSWEARSSSLFVIIDAKTGAPIDPMSTQNLKDDEGQTRVWTDCVLHDRARNLSLRLDGHGPSRDMLEAAGQFRDELQRIHNNLIE